eukprot:67136_1
MSQTLQVLKDKVKLHLKQNQWIDAERILREMLTIDASNDVILTQMAEVLSNAEQCYIKYNIINPSNDFIDLNLAKLYTKQQKYPQANEAFKRCDFNKAAVNYDFGVYLVSINQLQNALKYFQRAVNIEPNVMKYLFEYNKLCVKLKEYKQTKRSFTDAAYA